MGVLTRPIKPYHVHLGIPAVPKMLKPNAPPEVREGSGRS
jgi:hypothetical protein